MSKLIIDFTEYEYKPELWLTYYSPEKRFSKQYAKEYEMPDELITGEKYIYNGIKFEVIEVVHDLDHHNDIYHASVEKTIANSYQQAERECMKFNNEIEEKKHKKRFFNFLK